MKEIQEIVDHSVSAINAKTTDIKIKNNESQSTKAQCAESQASESQNTKTQNDQNLPPYSQKREYVLIDHDKPWTYEENGLTVTRGSAWTGPGCHIGCGVLLYTDSSGKLVKVEGDPENPFNGGRLCVRCLDLPEVTNSDKRLTYPLKRDKAKRGRNEWERISWDEAFNIIEAKFKELAKEYGPESVLFMQGTGRDIAAWISRLAWSYGSPNYGFPLSGLACYLPRVSGMYSTTGSFWVCDCAQQFPDRYANPKYQAPEVMILWGNNPLVSNSDGFFGHWVIDLQKMGMKTIVCDPRMTWLGAKAEIQLPVRPGTDAALALGLLNVIVSEDLYDHEFVELWCYGFEELAKRVLEYPVERVAEICWVNAEDIYAAARLFAKAKRACVQWGVAVDMTREALPAIQAIAALTQITGNIDRPGGMIIPPEILFYGGGFGADLLSKEQTAKRLGSDKYSLLKFGFATFQPDVAMEAMETGKPYAIKALWLQTTNTIACMGADPKRWLKAAQQMDFIVCVDLFFTPTIMALADIVLPAATYPERDGLRIGDGPQRGETINKVTQIGECKSDMQINLELGRRLNPSAWPWANVKDMFSALIKETGYDFDGLREVAPAYPKYIYHKHEKGLLRPDGQPGFNTPTGRIELWATVYANAGLDPLPYFEEPEPGPGSTPELLAEYPLVLTTGARNWGMFHSEHRNIPRLRALRPDPLIEVHPQTAERYGLKDGDWVWVENQRDRAKRKVKVTDVLLDPRYCSTDHAWWFPEADPENLYDVFDLNINNNVTWTPGKSGFGSNYKCMLVKLYKVK
ncbi:MAG: molybdopterin-dependent oxidoreductase [Coriobacteriales bacterium]|jgi:anaerobic selenocysteine-containing dehydrogenase|nr:molybdopterin-dependent oxidoreductase [Coriobacteriales bacterium]